MIIKKYVMLATLAVNCQWLMEAPVQAAEGVTVTPFYGYLFGGTIDTYNDRLQIRDKENYGLSIDVPYQQDITAQFTYIHHATTLIYTDYYLAKTEQLFDLDVDYYLLGGTKIISKGAATSFFSGTMGVTHFSPQSSQYGSEDVFTFSMGLGLDKDISDKVGLRVQGRLLLPIEFSGGSLYCGTKGCAVDVSGSTTLIQADVTAGIFIRL